MLGESKVFFQVLSFGKTASVLDDIPKCVFFQDVLRSEAALGALFKL